MTAHRPRVPNDGPPEHAEAGHRARLVGDRFPGVDADAHRVAVLERLRQEAADDTQRWPDPDERHDQWAARTFGTEVPPAKAYEFWLRAAGVPEERLRGEAELLAAEVARRRAAVLHKGVRSTRQ